jgi:anthranilate 1,2-dioxygenase large subunit
VVRGENDAVHIWENRCAHRGARLCWKNKGKEESFSHLTANCRGFRLNVAC